MELNTFDYVSVMVAVILGLGLTRIFAGIGLVLQLRQKIKTYWIHSLWVLIIILFHFHIWWAFGDYRRTFGWTYATFIYVLIGPGVLVASSNVLFPFLLQSQKIHFKQHYYATRRLFFSMFAVIVIWSMLLGPVLRVQPLLIRYRIIQTVGLGLVVVCAIFKNPVVHAIVVIVLIGFLLFTIAVFRRHVGAFAPGLLT